MKGYEYTILAALVTIVILMSSPNSCLGAPSHRGRRGNNLNWRRTRGSLSCSTSPASYRESNTFYIRSSCRESGFLTVVKNKVLIQISGLNSSHPDAEFVKETCSQNLRFNSAFSSAPLVRYRHKNSSKYVCFTKKGRVKPVSAKRVKRRGRLCMFREKLLESGDPNSSLGSSPDSSTYHTIQSANKMAWYMGFNPSKPVRIPERGHPGSLPRKGVIGSRNVNNRCDFKFHSGAHGPKPVEDKFIGFLARIEADQTIDKGSDTFSSTMVSKAANSGKVERRKSDKFSKISAAEREFFAEQRRLKNSDDKIRKIRHSSQKKLRPSRKSKNLRKRYGRKKAMTSKKRRQFPH